MKLRIADYCLIVSSVEKSAAFYKDVIGLPMRMRNENFADFDLGNGARLALWEYSPVSQVVGEKAIGPRGNRMMCAFCMDSPQAVDTAYHELSAKGVDFVAEPKDWPWGARAAYFKDLDGFLWEIYAWKTKPRTL